MISDRNSQIVSLLKIFLPISSYSFYLNMLGTCLYYKLLIKWFYEFWIQEYSQFGGKLKILKFLIS